jgi:16S rRNA (cytidine1402-2'-O)-methyltransferase
MATQSGRLLICATPIGNLEDITLRALRILREVDVIAAEDTRVTRKLLSFYDIKTHLISYYRHNEARRIPELISRLKEGQTVALVSDAGMPGVSDPGALIIKEALEEDIPIEIIPGASALLSALVISGLRTDSFSFHGFLPRKKADRKRVLKRLSAARETLIFYEAPHRIEKTLEDLCTEMSGRGIALARELTKKFEEIRRGTVEEVLDSVQKRPVKGEIVLVVEGAGNVPVSVSDDEITARLNSLAAAGVDKKDAVRSVVEELEVSKRRVYGLAEKAGLKRTPAS